MLKKFGPILGSIFLFVIGYCLRYAIGFLVGCIGFICEILGNLGLSGFIGISKVLETILHFFWSKGTVGIVMSSICSIVLVIFALLLESEIKKQCESDDSYSGGTNSSGYTASNAINDYNREIDDHYTKNFVFVDYSGAFRHWGENFIDGKGGWARWGDGFYDSQGNWIHWGDDFVDGKGNWCKYGDGFHDAQGNWVRGRS